MFFIFYDIYIIANYNISFSNDSFNGKIRKFYLSKHVFSLIGTILLIFSLATWTNLILLFCLFSLLLPFLRVLLCINGELSKLLSFCSATWICFQILSTQFRHPVHLSASPLTIFDGFLSSIVPLLSSVFLHQKQGYPFLLLIYHTHFNLNYKYHTFAYFIHQTHFRYCFEF